MKKTTGCTTFAVLIAIVGLACSGKSAPAAGSDIKIWPLFYHAADPVTDVSRTELLWPIAAKSGCISSKGLLISQLYQRYSECSSI